MFYVFIYIYNIMNVLRTGMNMATSRIPIWVCNISIHQSLSFMAADRTSKLEPMSAQSKYKNVLAGRPTLARLLIGVHKRKPPMS